MSPEMQARIQFLRQKAMSNDLTLDEMREIVKLLREDRVTVGVAKKEAKVKKSGASESDLLSELDNL